MSETEDRIFQPLILSMGSHEAGTGKGCAMNAISWIHGDEVITDFPTCSDNELSRLVQILNDSCGHLAGARRRAARGETSKLTSRDGDYDLFPEDAEVVIALGLATVGTGADTLTFEEIQKGRLAALNSLQVAAHESTSDWVYELENAYNYATFNLSVQPGTEEYTRKMAPIIAEAINAFKLAVAKPVVMPSRADVQVAYEKMVAAKV